MLKAVRSENLKYKRSFARKLALSAPLFFVLFAAVSRLYLPAESGLESNLMLAMIFNWWPVIFIPVGTAVLCALAELRERKAGQYRLLRSHDVAPSILWYGKIGAIGFHTLLSSIILIAAAIVACLIASRIGMEQIGTVVLSSLLLWLVSLALIPLHLFVAFFAGPFATIVLGFAGLLLGVIAAVQPYWIAVPWSWPTRLMAPVIGVHPNGVLLPEGDPLSDPSAVPMGLAAAALFLLATAVLTARGFQRREVH
jgi:ABC-2 type transport system permease protein